MRLANNHKHINTVPNGASTHRFPRQGYGIAMALLTTTLWAFLPIVLKAALKTLPLLLITWFRPLFAFVVLLAALRLRGTVPLVQCFRPPLAAVAAGVLLAANYYTYLEGIRLSGAANAQVLIQFGSLFLVLSGVLFFKEPLSKLQIAGLCFTLLGFTVFCHDRFAAAQATSQSSLTYAFGSGVVVLSALCWATYAAIQKHLSATVHPQALNLIVFLVCAIALFPFVSLPSPYSISGTSWLLLIVLGLNTLLAYVALAEAIKHAPVAIVSVIIVLNPMFSIAILSAAEHLHITWIEPEPITWNGFAGALVALLGTVLVVRGRQ